MNELNAPLSLSCLYLCWRTVIGDLIMVCGRLGQGTGGLLEKGGRFFCMASNYKCTGSRLCASWLWDLFSLRLSFMDWAMLYVRTVYTLGGWSSKSSLCIG